MKESPSWLRRIEEKAKLANISLDSAMMRDAIYSVEQEKIKNNVN